MKRTLVENKILPQEGFQEGLLDAGFIDYIGSLHDEEKSNPDMQVWKQTA